jgi:hypothetical protein|tara:strand:- start:1591 stop:1758 length:168 start_codon:yes stop_codon:yes gene_type:complete
MAYKYNSAPTKQDDIYAKKSIDGDSDTYIDFEEDYIGLVANVIYFNPDSTYVELS